MSVTPNLLGRIVALLCAGALLLSPASASVRFGSGVYVGGHNFSHQTFDRRHRAVVYIYERTPRHAGCTVRADGLGGRVKVCHLRRIRSR